MNNEEKLKKIILEAIKTSIKQIIKEEDYGSYPDSLSGIYSDYWNSDASMHAGDSGSATAQQTVSSLAGILPIGIVPRVGKTLMWGVENMTNRVIGLLKTVFAYLKNAFIPGLSAVADYHKIREDEAQQLAQIDQKYAETLKANLAVLYDLDAWGVVFLLDPSLGLGWRLLEKAPSAAVAIANALTGGQASKIIKNTFEHSGYRLSDLGQDPSFRGLFSQLGMTDLGLAEAENKTNKLIPLLKQALNSKELKNAISTSNVTKNIQNFAYNTILNRAKLILDKQTLEELSQIPELRN
jgi:hypothetical protein